MVAGCFEERRREQGNAGAGGIWGCRCGGGRWGWDACMHSSRVPRMQVCRSRFLAREGTGGSGRWAVCTSGAAGGELSTTKGRSSHLGGRGRSARCTPNEQPPQEVRATARSSSRQSLHLISAWNLPKGPCAGERKLSSANGPALRLWPQDASTRADPPPDTPQKLPAPPHVAADTEGSWALDHHNRGKVARRAPGHALGTGDASTLARSHAGS